MMTENGTGQPPVTGRFGGRVQLSDGEMRDEVKLRAALDQLFVSLERRLVAAKEDGRQVFAEVTTICDVTLVYPEEAQIGDHVNLYCLDSWATPRGQRADGTVRVIKNFQRQPNGLWKRIE